MDRVVRKKRTLIHEGTILDYYQDEMELPNGKTEIWDFVSHRKGAAAVVPVLPNGNLILTYQYRNALERYTLEIPAGSRDSVDEDTAICAQRELYEETGYKSDSWKRLLSLKSTVAFCDELIDVYLARDIYKVGSQELDEAESIELKEMTLDEVLELIYIGTIQDAKTVAGILAYYGTLH